MAQLDSLLGDSSFEETEENAGFDPIPAGEYEAQIEFSEVSDTQTGGKKLTLCYTVIEGDYAGRKIWDNLNIVNASATAQTIARGMMKSICLAVGLTTSWPEDSILLHEKPVSITVAIKSDPNYGPKNVIKKVEPVGASHNNALSPAPTGGVKTGAARKPAWKK